MVLYKGRLYSLSLPLVYFVVRMRRNTISVRFTTATSSASGAIRYKLSTNSSVLKRVLERV